MKNVNGLVNAMRLIESACEKGEITIIGEGSIPTPVELYKKCVAFINEKYGVDILNLVLKENKPCECNDTCYTVTVEIDEGEKVIVVDLGKVEDIVEKIICDDMGCLSDSLKEDIVREVKAYYEDIDGNIPEDYDTEYATDGIHAALDYRLNLDNFDEDYIENIISKIVSEVDKQCISVE